MDLSKFFHRFKSFLALILALIISIFCLGCSEVDVGDILDIAADVIDIIDEVQEDGVYSNTPDDTRANSPPENITEAAPTESNVAPIDEDGSYYSKEEVALYIHTYGRLPANFITKSEAGELGWEGGPVERYAEGCAIGGDRFGNREGILPEKSGRTYTECDIDTQGASSRGAKRIVFSNDGLIYYTDDHYETFTLLYGEE